MQEKVPTLRREVPFIGIDVHIFHGKSRNNYSLLPPVTGKMKVQIVFQ